MLSSKGFLGPIGDDLPSLVPLLLALIIFFSTFTMTFNIFSSKSADFAADIDALSVARVLKGSSYISGIEHFSKLCGSLTVYRVNYFAGLTDAVTNPNPNSSAEGVIDIFNLDLIDSTESGTPYVCTNLPEGESPTSSMVADRKILTRIYAVALEQDSIVRPVHLVVVMWK